MTPAATQLFRQQAFIDGQWCDAQDATTQESLQTAEASVVLKAG